MASRNLLKLGLCFALAGCSGIDHATLDGVTAMPDDSSLTINGGAMHTGIATGFKPRVAIPIARPMMLASANGVLKTRSGPYFRCKPAVALKTPVIIAAYDSVA